MFSMYMVWLKAKYSKELDGYGEIALIFDVILIGVVLELVFGKG